MFSPYKLFDILQLCTTMVSTKDQTDATQIMWKFNLGVKTVNCNIDQSISRKILVTQPLSLLFSSIVKESFHLLCLSPILPPRLLFNPWRWSTSDVKLPSQTFERLGCNCTTHSGLPISHLLFLSPPMMDLFGLAVPLSQWHLKWQLPPFSGQINAMQRRGFEGLCKKRLQN